MARVRIRWRRGCWADIRTLPGVMTRLNREAQRIAASAGNGFVAKPATETGGRVRGRAAVVTTTRAAMRAEATQHVLLRSI